MTSPTEERIIIGLGNPGRGYEYTRHNLGFLVLSLLAKQLKAKFVESSLTKGLTAECQYEQCNVHLLMPMTYMNKSGVAVRQYLQEKSFDLANVLVVCDDFNLPYGQLRLRAKGSDGGHNGLNSVIELLASEDFARLRMGIGQPKDKADIVDFVLEKFSRQEQKGLNDFIQEAAECCLLWLTSGMEKAMERFNQKK